MSAPYTVGALSDQMDAEFAWRRKELSTLLTLFQRAPMAQRDAIGRAALVSLYAHWEGFVREAVQLYLHHVSCRRDLCLQALPVGMAFAWYPNALAGAQNVGSNPRLKVEIIAEIDRLRETRIRNMKPSVDTRSNLSLAILEDLDCLVGNIGLAEGIDRIWLDDKLVKKRNTIAHGRSATIEFDEFRTMLGYVTGWMQGIGNKLVNAAVLKSYLLSPPINPPSAPPPGAPSST